MSKLATPSKVRLGKRTITRRNVHPEYTRAIRLVFTVLPHNIANDCDLTQLMCNCTSDGLPHTHTQLLYEISYSPSVRIAPPPCSLVLSPEDAVGDITVECRHYGGRFLLLGQFAFAERALGNAAGQIGVRFVCKINTHADCKYDQWKHVQTRMRLGHAFRPTSRRRNGNVVSFHTL